MTTNQINVATGPGLALDSGEFIPSEELATAPAAPAEQPSMSNVTHDWRDSPSYGGEICANCGAVNGTRRSKLACGQKTETPQRRWPFAETPGEFTKRLREAMQGSGDLLAAVRHVLIERPALVVPHTPLAAAPAPQPDTANAALPVECDSPELCAVSRACAGQFGTKRICASQGQAPAQAAPAVVAVPTFEDFCKRHGLDPKKMDGHGGMWARVALDECRATTQPAAAPSVLEDAARYRHIRDVPHSEEVRSVLSLQQNAVMDKVIDKDRAAMAAKKGDAHE